MPIDLQQIIEVAASAAANETLADFQYHNIDAWGPLTEEGVEVRTFPDDVVRALGRTTKEVLDELAASDPLTGRVHESFMGFLPKANRYADHFDRRLLEMRSMALGEA